MLLDRQDICDLQPFCSRLEESEKREKKRKGRLQHRLSQFLTQLHTTSQVELL